MLIGQSGYGIKAVFRHHRDKQPRDKHDMACPRTSHPSCSIPPLSSPAHQLLARVAGCLPNVTMSIKIPALLSCRPCRGRGLRLRPAILAIPKVWRRS